MSPSCPARLPDRKPCRSRCRALVDHHCSLLPLEVPVASTDALGMGSLAASQPTFYRTQIARFGLYPLLAAWLVFSLPLIVAPRGGWPIHLGGVVFVLASLWSFRLPGRMGVTVRSEGIVVGHILWSRFIPWENVEQFDTRRWGFNHEVGIRLPDGQRAITSLLQGRVVAWDGGKTRDILSVLNAAKQAAKSRR
jgi:hypothetical protein